MTEESFCQLLLTYGPWPASSSWPRKWEWLQDVGVRIGYREEFHLHPLFRARASYYENLFFWAAVDEITQEEVYTYLRRLTDE